MRNDLFQKFRRDCCKWLALTSTLVMAQTAMGQVFPAKPVTIIVAAAAGGSSDITARAVAEGLQARWKQPVVVDNKAGANGFVAAQALRKSAPDGYTLMLGSVGQMMLNPIQHGNDWLPESAYTMVGQVSKTYMVMVAAPAAPYKDLREYVSYAKSNAGKASYSSSGVGSLMHIAGDAVRRQAGADIAHVPYKGEALALTDIIAGNVSAGFVVAGTAVPFVQSGKLKALAISDTERAPALPNVQTATEQGFDVAMPVWNGIVGPNGMPAALVAQINSDLNEVLRSESFRQKMLKIDITPAPTSSDQFGRFVADQSVRWKNAVVAGGIELR